MWHLPLILLAMLTPVAQVDDFGTASAAAAAAGADGVPWGDVGAGLGWCGLGAAIVGGFWKWRIGRDGHDARLRGERAQHDANLGQQSFAWLLEDHKLLRQEVKELKDDNVRLRDEVDDLRRVNAQLRENYAKLLRAYQWVCELSREEINRLLAQLKLPLIQRWPPDGQAPAPRPQPQPAKGLRQRPATPAKVTPPFTA